MRSFKKGIIGAIVISSLSLVFNGIVGSNHTAYAALPDAPEVAGGEGYSLSLASNGTVWGWGRNSSGTLGDGTNIDQLKPVKVEGLLTGKTVSAISSRYMHTLAISDGSVYAWGINSSGQLGDASITDRKAPIKVAGLLAGKTIKAIATGMTHSLALTSTGTLYAWGNNDSGQLGDGTTATHAQPVLVSGLLGKTVVAIAAGNFHSVAVISDGSVYAWGNNSYGQLGDGTPSNKLAPVRVIGVSGKNIKKVAAGYYHTLALASDGTVWASGSNSSGQLGDGTTINRPTSVKLNSLVGKNITDITAENDHSLALADDHSVMSWGENDQYQLGDGTTISRSTPVTASALTGKVINKISSGTHHSLAVDNNGVVWTWGGNNNGELGDGTTNTSPTAVHSLADVAIDKAALALTYKVGDSATKVTYNITLPTAGDNGTTITWQSNDTAVGGYVVISPGLATVTRDEDADTNVILTATINNGSISDSREFPIKVLQTDTGAVAQASTNLEIGFNGGNTISNVTKNVYLTAGGTNGTSVTWASSHPNVISTTGVVYRQAAGSTDVTLTATISRNDAHVDKSFINVIVPQQTDADAVIEAEAALTVGFTGSETALTVKSDIILPVQGINGTAVSWSSNSPSIISDTGDVTRPINGDKDVILTATITKAATPPITKNIPLKVLQTDASAVAQTKANVTLVTYGGSDTGTSVTENLVLKTTDIINGTTITWESSNPAAISATGVVVRSATATVVVTLTATITKNLSSVKAPVVLTVMQTDVGAVPSAKAALAIKFATGDSLAKVTRDLTLPGTGLSGTTITWTSSKPAVISNNGVVTSPTDADVSVDLTATITKGIVQDSRVFTLKVYQSDSSAVATAKAALLVVFGAGETAASVTKKLTLATAGLKGTTVSWSSSPTGVISSAGVITRRADSDANVILTATITKTSISNLPTSDTKVFTSIFVPQSEIGAINEAKADMLIGFSGGETAAKVTKNLSLPSSGTNTTTIIWTSSAPAIIAPSGIVKRPTTVDTIVNLTATVRKGTAVGTKVYKITVPQTDASALDAAQKALVLKFFKGDSALSVTNTVYLAPTGVKGTTVVWHSDTPAAINDGGAVTRLSGGNATVTLKATLSKDGASVNKEFVVKVPQIDAGAVANTKTALNLSGLTFAPGETSNTVKSKITLPTKGSNGATITWNSDTPKVVNAAGAVARQPDGNTTVKLTATIKKNAEIDSTLEFTVIVLQSDAGAATLAKTPLVIGYNSGDTQGNVTHNLTLPVVGAFETVVSWTSSNEAVISSAGGVTQVLAKDTNVTLTASIKKNTSIAKVTFILTVPKVDDSATAAAKTILAIGYSRGDKVTNVTKDLTLPLIAANKAVVTWSSNNTGVVSEAGVVTRDANADINVILTATITISGASFSRDYPIIVIQADAGAIAEAKADLVIGYTGTETDARVTQNISLLKTGTNNTTIVWTSNSPAINAAGVITRQLTGNKTVTLIATIKKNGVTDTKVFVLVVPQLDLGAVNQDKAALVVGFAVGDTALAVTDDLTLASSGTSGTTITWLSSDTSVISNSGTVSPIAGKKVVIKLTATITKNAITTTKIFTLSV